MLIPIYVLSILRLSKDWLATGWLFLWKFLDKKTLLHCLCGWVANDVAHTLETF